MSTDDYINELQAASFAGVSSNTLKRFAEAGYLKIDKDSSGNPHYSKNDITAVFGITDGSLARKTEEPIAELQEDPRGEPQETPESKVKSSVIQFPNNKEEEPKVIVEESTKEREYFEPEVRQTEVPIDNELKEKVVSLSNVIEIQEKILVLKDEQIVELRKERDWLKERVEKLEEKGDRDQLLLLSETQVLRQLITSNSQKKSPVRATLEWLGFTKPEPEVADKRQPIDM